MRHAAPTRKHRIVAAMGTMPTIQIWTDWTLVRSHPLRDGDPRQGARRKGHPDWQSAPTPTIEVVALGPARRPSDRRPRAATYFGYDAPRNQEAVTKATTDTALHRTADEPPSRLECHHGQHSSAMSHPATTWPEDHDDSHDPTCTKRQHSLQAKLARPSLKLSTL